MRFNEKEKEVIGKVLFITTQSIEKESQEAQFFDEIEKRIATDQMIVGNYLHLFFIELKKSLTNDIFSEEEHLVLKEIHRKVLRRINANK